MHEYFSVPPMIRLPQRSRKETSVQLDLERGAAISSLAAVENPSTPRVHLLGEVATSYHAEYALRRLRSSPPLTLLLIVDSKSRHGALSDQNRD